MNMEILLLGVFIGITLLAYMVAINAHGPVRLGLSYLIATVMLAGTVWAVVQHVNAQQNVLKVEEMRKLEQDKQRAEQKVEYQEKELVANKGRLNAAAKLNLLIAKGTSVSTYLSNVNLQDGAGDLDGLTARAAEMARKVSDFKTETENFGNGDTLFAQSVTLIKESAQFLTEASYYYRYYYKSDDSDQEQLRERLMRQKAREAGDRLQKATALIVSGT